MPVLFPSDLASASGSEILTISEAPDDSFVESRRNEHPRKEGFGRGFHDPRSELCGAEEFSLFQHRLDRTLLLIRRVTVLAKNTLD